NWIPLTTTYPDWSNIQNRPTSFPSSNHDHDSRYYTKLESDNALLQKRNISVPIPVEDITTDELHQFVTDAEKIVWNNPPVSDWNTIANKPASFPSSAHDHDSRYYTKLEIDSSLLQKRNVSIPITAT
ncbi:hypothetical protein QRD38_18175, partial [Leptospira weilii]|nr:hypothetical protein [Leptospira weilii]